MNKNKNLNEIQNQFCIVSLRENLMKLNIYWETFKKNK
jgi:hypothetical protein